MKTTLLFFFLIAAAVNPLLGQVEWISIGQPSSILWTATYFTDKDHGTVVGSDGNIIFTTDGGSSWDVGLSGTTEKLTSVFYLNANLGFVTGLNGTLLKTTNGGLNWTAIPTGTSQAVFDVYFWDTQTGIIAGQGGMCQRTANGGNSWVTINPRFSSNNVYSMEFRGGSTGFAVGNAGKISRSTNSGTSWRSRSSGVSYGLAKVDFWNPKVATVVGSQGTIRRTVNTGTNWTAANSNIALDSYELRSVHYIDSLIAYIVGWKGIILKTTDGGANWNAQNSNTFAYLEDVFFVDKNTGYAVGWDGAIMKTRTAGDLLPPILVSPPNTNPSTPVSGQFVWKSVDGAATYTIQVSTGPSFLSNTIDQKGIADTTYNYAGLAPNTTYYWRVRGEKPGSVGWWSTVWAFTTALAAPRAPILQSPAKDTTSVPLSRLLIWIPSAGATSNNVQLSTVQDFSSTVMDEQFVAGGSIAFSGLQNSTDYFWRVQAVNAGGKSQWSDVWKFTTIGTIPPAPTLISPTDKATKIPKAGTLTWTTVVGAESYSVQLSETPDFQAPVVDRSGLQSTWHTYSSLDYETIYYWRARAYNSFGYGPWSDVWSFTTVAAVPQAPVLLSPGKDTTGVQRSGHLVWLATVVNNTYDVQLSESQTFHNAVIDKRGVDSTSYPFDNLEKSTKYYWHVRAVGPGGTGSWSERWSFTTLGDLPAAPELLSPTDAMQCVEASEILQWRESAGSTSYFVQIALSSAFSSPLVDEKVTSTSYSASGLNPDTKHYWRVRAENSSGMSAWSDTWSFTTKGPVPAVPQLSSPLDDATDVPVSSLLKWSGAAGATSYIVQIALTSSFTSPLVEEKDIAMTEYGFAGLAGETKHYWRVLAATECDSSAWSDVRSFTTTKATAVDRPAGPDVISLEQSYPNPASVSQGTTVLRFHVSEAVPVTLSLVNMLGQTRDVPAGGRYVPGQHEVQIDISDMKPGVYFYHVQAEHHILWRKLVLLP